MDENTIEFSVKGTMYTGDKEVTIEDIALAFNHFCIYNGWTFVGMTDKWESGSNAETVAENLKILNESM